MFQDLSHPRFLLRSCMSMGLTVSRDLISKGWNPHHKGNSTGSLVQRILARWTLVKSLYTSRHVCVCVCVSSLRGGHANLPCIVPMLTEDPQRKSIIRAVFKCSLGNCLFGFSTIYFAVSCYSCNQPTATITTVTTQTLVILVMVNQFHIEFHTSFGKKLRLQLHWLQSGAYLSYLSIRSGRTTSGYARSPY